MRFISNEGSDSEGSHDGVQTDSDTCSVMKCKPLWRTSAYRSVFPLSSHDFTFKASHSHPGYQTRRPVLTPPLRTEGIPWSVLYLWCATRQMEGSLMTRCLTSRQCNQSPQTRAEADTWHRNMSRRCSHPRRRDGAGIICGFCFFLFCVTVWNEHKRY